MTHESAQVISWIGIALFAYIVVVVPIALFVQTSRRQIRWMAFSVLAATAIASIACGLLYYWQHFVRLG